jgi:hypothetical protein
MFAFEDGIDNSSTEDFLFQDRIETERDRGILLDHWRNIAITPTRMSLFHPAGDLLAWLGFPSASDARDAQRG